MTATATVRCEQKHRYLHCAIVGEIDPTNTDDVRKALLDGAVGQTHGLVVDLSALTFVDSAGIAMLFDVARRLRHGSSSFAFVLPPEAVIYRVLSIARLAEIVPVYPDVSSAESALEAAAS